MVFLIPTANKPFSQPSCPMVLPRVSTRKDKSQRPKGQDATISALNTAIESFNLTEGVSSIPPAKAVFGSISTLLTMIRVCSCFLQRSVPGSHLVRTQWLMNWTMSSSGYCAPMSVKHLAGESMERNRRSSASPYMMRSDNWHRKLNQRYPFRTVHQNSLGHRIMVDIQGGLVKQAKRNAVSRRLHAKNDKRTIATWRLDLENILLVFKVHPAI